LDLSSLDKFAAKAKEANTVTLTHDQLHAAAGFIPSDDKDSQDKVKKVMAGLDSVQVRNYEFEQAGEFSDADLDSVRAQIAKLHGCTSIVDSKSKKEHSQVFLCSEEGKTTGIIVLDSEPKELNVVYVKGNMNMSDLGKLNGMMGIPKIDIGPTPHPNPKPDVKDDDN
jgi:hypothetical protein